MRKTNRKFVRLIFDEYHDELHHFLLGRLRNQAFDATDVMQETYLRLLRLKDTQVIEQPRAYVYRVALNVVQELGIKEKTHAALPDRLTDPSIQAAGPTPPDDAAEHDIHVRALERAVGNLPARTQAILIMRKRDGLSRREIANQLGVSEHTVKKHLLRAVAWCRERGVPDRSQD